MVVYDTLIDIGTFPHPYVNQKSLKMSSILINTLEFLLTLLSQFSYLLNFGVLFH